MSDSRTATQCLTVGQPNLSVATRGTSVLPAPGRCLAQNQTDPADLDSHRHGRPFHLWPDEWPDDFAVDLKFVVATGAARQILYVKCFCEGVAQPQYAGFILWDSDNTTFKAAQ